MSILSGKRVAVIGLGGMGMRHLEGYQARGATIVAVADMRPETKDTVLALCPDTHWYDSWETLFKNEPLDVVSIVTNGPSHADIAVCAAESRVPYIMCEKPMATSISDAERMCEAAEKNGSQLFVNFTLRVFPLFQKVESLIAEGHIGTLRTIHISIGGARGLGCVGSHYADFMRVLTKSEPVRVEGSIDQTHTPNVRGAQFQDPGGVGFFTFKNGTRGFIDMSEDLTLPPHMTIIGTQGRITIDVAQHLYILEKMLEDKTWSREVMSDVPEISLTEGTQLMLEHALLGNPTVSTGKDGVQALHMILGIHAAAQKGGETPLPLSGDQKTLNVAMT